MEYNDISVSTFFSLKKKNLIAKEIKNQLNKKKPLQN